MATDSSRGRRFFAEGISPWAQRPLGLKLIVLYKFAKAPVMLAVALWLTCSPGSAYRSLESVAHELADGGAVWGRVGEWIHLHLTTRALVGGAALAWLDALTTGVEGVLLLSGRTWAEWVVVIALASLVPFELWSLEHRPGVGKVVVLAANTAIVIYLARRRRAAAHVAKA